MHEQKLFANPIAVKERKASKTFAAPSKEQATTGRFMQAGDDYGVGHRQPVGHAENPKQDVAVLPRKPKCHELK